MSRHSQRLEDEVKYEEESPRCSFFLWAYLFDGFFPQGLSANVDSRRVRQRRGFTVLFGEVTISARDTIKRRALRINTRRDRCLVIQKDRQHN